MKNINAVSRSPYAFSEKMYLAECAFGYMISIITSGAYLAKLTSTIGISDATTAILSNITSLACIFQLFSIPLSHKNTLKSSVLPLRLLSNIFIGSLYLIPFFGFGAKVNSVLFFICILLSYASMQICAPLKFTWFMSLPSPERKGSFQSLVQIVSHICGLVFSLGASLLLDYFSETNKTEWMFITFTAVIFTLTVLNFLSLALSKEKPRKHTEKLPLIKEIRIIIKNKSFIRYIFVYLTYSVGIAVTNAFLGTYQVNELDLSMFQIYILSAFTAVTAIFFLAFFGNYARKHNLTQSMKIGYPIYALSYLIIAFTVPSNGFVMLLIFHFVNTLGSAGLVVGVDPIIFDIVSEEQRTTALSVKNIIGGAMSFAATLCLTPLFNFIQKSGNTVLGFNMYAQQLFGLISAAFMLISLFLFSRFVKKSQS